MALRGRPPVPRAVRAGFWDGVRSGLGMQEAAEAVGGVSRAPVPQGRGRYLSLAEREEIAVGLAARLSYREIARRLGRPASTVSRKIARNSTRGRYRYRAVAA